MKHKIQFIALAGLILLCFSCRKEKIIEVEVEKEYSWKINEGFLHFNKIQLNSFADESGLHTIGRSRFATVFLNEIDSSQEYVEHAILNYSNSLIYRPTITKEIFIGIRDASIGFYSTQNPNSSGSYTWMSMLAIDSSFVKFDFPTYAVGESVVLNNNNQCLIAYKRSDVQHTSFAIGQLAISKEVFYTAVDLTSVTKFPEIYNFGEISTLHTFDEFFFITSGTTTFRVSPDIGIDTVFTNPFTGGLVKMFKHKDNLYGLTYAELYQSNDDGKHWNLILGGMTDDLWRLNFKIINNEIIGYGNSQLFHLVIENNELISIDELENDAIAGNAITSISLFKGKVYVTTLSGVFTRKIDDFLTYKSK